MSTIIPGGAEMKLIELEDEGFLVEETIRQVCLDGQRFNVNVVIRGIMLM